MLALVGLTACAHGRRYRPRAEPEATLGFVLHSGEAMPDRDALRAIYTPPGPRVPWHEPFADIETVEIAYCVSTDGKTHDIEALRGRPELADAARLAARSWRFRPRRDAGAFVPSCSQSLFVYDFRAHWYGVDSGLVATFEHVTEGSLLQRDEAGADTVMRPPRATTPLSVKPVDSTPRYAIGRIELRMCIDGQGEAEPSALVAVSLNAARFRRDLWHVLRSNLAWAFEPATLAGHPVEVCDIPEVFDVYVTPVGLRGEAPREPGERS